MKEKGEGSSIMLLNWVCKGKSKLKQKKVSLNVPAEKKKREETPPRPHFLLEP
jgi:hypothetical protein